MESSPLVEDLGRRPFADVHAQMHELADSIRAGRSPGKILLVEHEPIYTAGRATAPERLGVEVVEVERGGQVTYHGPGQLVVYPIVRLVDRDVNAWLRRLEAFGVALCGAFGVDAEPSPDRTGVFADGRKLASIGVAIRRWINLHGIAINVDMDLGPFARIRPCGLDPSIMTDLSRAAGRTISIGEAKRAARLAVGLLSGLPRAVG
jgi:lipoyl(octanoyl) transferase